MSVKNIEPKNGENFWEDEMPVKPTNVLVTNKRAVNVGEW